MLILNGNNMQKGNLRISVKSCDVIYSQLDIFIAVWQTEIQFSNFIDQPIELKKNYRTGLAFIGSQKYQMLSFESLG